MVTVWDETKVYLYLHGMKWCNIFTLLINTNTVGERKQNIVVGIKILKKIVKCQRALWHNLKNQCGQNEINHSFVHN